MQRLQLTLAIIKPHAVKNPVALSYIRHVIKTKFVVVKTKRLSLDTETAANFYKEHVGKFFYNRLVTFMTRYIVYILKKFFSAWRPADTFIILKQNIFLHVYNISNFIKDMYFIYKGYSHCFPCYIYNNTIPCYIYNNTNIPKPSN